MRLGISTNAFFNRVSTESAFDVLRQMRVDAAEVRLTTFSEYEQRFADALAPRKGNIFVNSVHPDGAQFEPGLFSTNARVRADAENIFKKVCYAANKLGARYYIFQGPVKLKKTEYEFDFVRLGDRVNQLCEIARGYGVFLSYENAFYSYADRPDYFKQLLKFTPNLTCTLSIKHALIAAIDPVKFLDVMDGRISTVLLCDLKKDNSTALPGEGRFNFEKFFTELYKRNINTVLILDVLSRDYREVNQLRACYDYISALTVKARI